MKFKTSSKISDSKQNIARTHSFVYYGPLLLLPKSLREFQDV